MEILVTKWTFGQKSELCPGKITYIMCIRASITGGICVHWTSNFSIFKLVRLVAAKYISKDISIILFNIRTSETFFLRIFGRKHSRSFFHFDITGGGIATGSAIFYHILVILRNWAVTRLQSGLKNVAKNCWSIFTLKTFFENSTKNFHQNKH